MTLIHRISSTIASLALGMALVYTAAANAGHDTETDSNDVILAGHDVVAYFTQGKPVEGSSKYTAVYNGAIYQFSNKRNRNTFREDPARYAPQYGGFCAYGMTFGKKFEVDGKAFEVVDGKLFVNKNRSVYKTWAEDIPKHIAQAEGQWPSVEHTPAKDL